MAPLAEAFFKSICPSICLCVCVCSPFKCIFAPTCYSLMSKFFLEIWNPWEKLLEKVVSGLKTFTNKGCKIAIQK